MEFFGLTQSEVKAIAKKGALTPEQADQLLKEAPADPGKQGPKRAHLKIIGAALLLFLLLVKK